MQPTSDRPHVSAEDAAAEELRLAEARLDEALPESEREERRRARARARIAREAAERAERAAQPDPGQLPPDVLEALRQLNSTGRAGLGAASDAAKALRTLVAADFSLARSAFGRTLAFTGMAIAFGASAWLLLMAALIVFMSRQLGLTWAAALLITAVLSAALTWFAGWKSMQYFEHTRMQATRRQLARLGIGELSDFMPTPGASESSRDASMRQPPSGTSGKPAKDERGVDVTPP